MLIEILRSEDWFRIQMDPWIQNWIWCTPNILSNEVIVRSFGMRIQLDNCIIVVLSGIPEFTYRHSMP